MKWIQLSDHHLDTSMANCKSFRTRFQRWTESAHRTAYCTGFLLSWAYNKKKHELCGTPAVTWVGTDGSSVFTVNNQPVWRLSSNFSLRTKTAWFRGVEKRKASHPIDGLAEADEDCIWTPVVAILLHKAIHNSLYIRNPPPVKEKIVLGGVQTVAGMRVLGQSDLLNLFRKLAFEAGWTNKPII